MKVRIPVIRRASPRLRQPHQVPLHTAQPVAPLNRWSQSFALNRDVSWRDRTLEANSGDRLLEAQLLGMSGNPRLELTREGAEALYRQLGRWLEETG